MTGGPTNLSPQSHKELKRSSFTYTNIAINFGLIAFLFFVNALGSLGNTVCLGLLTLMALRGGVAGSLKALSILALVITGNPFIVQQSMVLTFFRFPLVAVAGAVILYQVLFKRPDLLKLPHLNALLFFGAVCLILAPINGYFIMISVLKACVFTYGAYAILVGTELNRSRMSDLTVWFTALIAFVVAVTYLTIPLGVSHVFRGELLYLGSAGGLSGITGHQQTLGSYAAASTIFCFAVGIFSKVPKRWVFIFLLLALLPILVMTKSRTAVGTLMLAVSVAVIASPFIARGRIANFNKISFVKWLIAFCFLGVFVYAYDLATGGAIAERVMAFALKGMSGRVYQLSAEDFASSRVGLVTQSWQIFLQHPLTGINFGTSLDPEFIENASTFTAPTEKGFIITAVLEEVGLIGATAFLLFLVLTFRKFYQDENIIGFTVFAGFLIQNIGEMMFFSLGGAGLFCWCLVGAGIAVGYRHQFIRG